MKYIIIFLLAISSLACSQKNEGMSEIAPIGVDELHTTQEYDDYRKALWKSGYSGTQIVNYSELSLLLKEQFEIGYTYETVDEDQFPEFRGAKEHILAIRKEWKTYDILDKKYNYNSLSKSDQKTIRTNYKKLQKNTQGGLQSVVDAHVANITTNK